MVSVPVQMRAEFNQCICIMYIVALDSLGETHLEAFRSPQSCENCSLMFSVLL